VDEIALPEGFYGMGGIILAEGLYDWGRGAVPFSVIPGICLTTEKKHGKQSG
jgi:hypothetical protein